MKAAFWISIPMKSRLQHKQGRIGKSSAAVLLWFKLGRWGYMKSALVLIDIQNDYFKGGKSELSKPEKAASNAKRVLEYYRSSNLPVYHIQHISIKEGAVFFLPDTEGAEIHESVKPIKGEKVFIKHVPNSFFDTGLADELEIRHVNNITVCGMMSHMCVDTTVRAAKDLGMYTTLIHDACATKDLVWENNMILAEDVHHAFMASLQGTFAEVVSTNEFLQMRIH